MTDRPVPGLLEGLLKQICSGEGPEDLWFSDADGNDLRRAGRSIGTTSWFAAAPEQPGVEWLAVHVLRHTAASLTVSSGANFFEEHLPDVASRKGVGKHPRSTSSGE